MAIDAQQIQTSLRKLRKFASKLSTHPSPGKIHKLRTTARKLESIFRALSLDSEKNERRLVRGLRKIRKRSGKVRDLDVLTGDLTTLHADGETDCQVLLLEHLGGKRQKQAGKLHKLVGKKRAKLKRQLCKASENLNKAVKNTESHLGSLAAAESLRLSSELEIPKRLTRRNLHGYRLKLKQLRYVLELAPDHPKFVDDLGETKDAIGDWHDWEELVGIANEFLDHGNCKLMRKLKETADSKFAHARRVAERLRRTYLKTASQTRKGPHRVALRQDAMAASAVFPEMQDAPPDFFDSISRFCRFLSHAPA